MIDSIDVSQLCSELECPRAKEMIETGVNAILCDFLREYSVLYRVLPPKLVAGTGSCVKLLGDNGREEDRHFDGVSIERRFHTFESKHFRGERHCLATRKYPVRKVVENDFAMGILCDLDEDFRCTLDAAVNESEQAIPAPDYKPSDLRVLVDEAKKWLSKNSNGSQRGYLIIPEIHWDEMAVLGFEEWGDKLSQTMRDGTRNIKTYRGLDVVTAFHFCRGTEEMHDASSDSEHRGDNVDTQFRTVPTNPKRSVWSNSLYVVAEQPLLGGSYMLGDFHSKIDYTGGCLQWHCWVTVGHVISNVRSVVRIDLIE